MYLPVHEKKIKITPRFLREMCCAYAVYFPTVCERGRRKKGWKRENGLPWKKTHFPLRISRSPRAFLRPHAHPFPSSKSEKNRREFVHRNTKEGTELEGEGMTKGWPWYPWEERKSRRSMTIRRARFARATDQLFRPLSDLLSRSGRTRRNIDSHVGGVDYDPPYPPTSSSIARLWINGWDDRFILIRINANLSTDACMNVCITINYNTGRDTNLCTVSFRRNSRSSKIILFKRMYDGYSSFSGGGKRGGDWKSVYEFVYASHVWANQFYTMLVK